MTTKPSTNEVPVLAPGGAFHVGDIVRNRQVGYEYDGVRHTVSTIGVWEARYYTLVHCPHQMASPLVVVEPPSVDWESIAVRVARADGGYHLLSTYERDNLETAIDAAEAAERQND